MSKVSRIVVAIVTAVVIVAVLGVVMNYYGNKHPCSNAGHILGKCATK